MRKRFSVVAAVAVAAASMLLTSCEKKPPPAREVVRPVKLLKLAEPGLYRNLSYPAQVSAFQEADLSFLVSGRLQEIAVKRGETVKKGQVLAKLDPQDYQNSYDAAQVAAKEREAYMKRIKAALDKDVATKTEYDQAVRGYEMNKAKAAIAKKALEDAELRAPFAGEIGFQYKENFQDVSAKEPIFRLQDVRKLKVIIDVPESVRILIRQAGARHKTGRGKGAETKAVFEDLDGREFDLEFYEDEKTADPMTRTYAVTLVMDAPGKDLILPGMSAVVRGRIKLPTPADKPGFRLPAAAVVSAPGEKRFVWVQDPKAGQVHRRDVEVGSLTGDEIEVTSGLAVGDIVAVSGVNYLDEGMKVRPLMFAARRPQG